MLEELAINKAVIGPESSHARPGKATPFILTAVRETGVYWPN